MKKTLVLVLLICSIAFAKTTFFTEDFNSDWSNSTPPAGWTIFNDTSSSPGWDKDSAGSHWSDNHSGYAQLCYASSDGRQSQNLDSLISPIINCYRFRNIVLRCSTFFHYNEGTDTAKIVGSIDGGLTYPYTVKNYYGLIFPNAQIESLDLNWAAEKDSVRLAWVFSGNLTNIQFWCIDDLSLIGDSVFDIDASCIEIIQPFTIQPPVACTVKARIVNFGKNNLISFPVCCSIQDFIGSSWYFQTTCFDLPAGETTEINLIPVWIPSDIPMAYQARVWTEAFGDGNLHNDTIQKNFSVSAVEVLSYCAGPVAGENFPIKEQGWGVKFTPNFYPVLFTQIECFLGASLPSVSYKYKIRIVDDDGPNSSPGTTLYETSIIRGNIEWNTAYISSDSIFITDGSVYVFYIQANDVPNAPLLYHDGSRTTSAQYYKYFDSTYVQDLPNGDWLLLLTVQYLDLIRHNNDVRTVYICNPNNEFVRRPYDYTTQLQARIENIGNNSQSNFAVLCSIQSYFGGFHRYTETETVPFLASQQATIVNFSPSWNVLYNEKVNIIVTTLLFSDQNRLNDQKVKACENDVGSFYCKDSAVTGYSWFDSDSTDGPTYNWVEPNLAFLATSVGDDTIIPITLPFPFNYCDSAYTKIYVSTNGFISFCSNQPSAYNNTIVPSYDAPNCALYPFWDDLILPVDQSAQIYYQTVGNAPERKFVITWYNVARKNSDYSQRLNFQVIFYENGQILFQYKNTVCGLQQANFGKDATIGMENLDGSSGLLYLYGSETEIVNWPKNKLTDHRAIKFYRPFWDVGTYTKLSPDDSIHPSSVTPRIIVKNYGTEVAESIHVYLTITPGSYSAYHFIPRLISDKQDTISFINWDALTPGTYTLNCSTDYRLDQRNYNNVLRKTILVARWIMKSPIPDGPQITRVKNGALAYNFDFNKIYALKGGNCNEFWCYDITSNKWDSLPRMPLLPSGKKPKGGCALVYAQGKIYALKGGNKNDFYEYTPREFDPLLPDSLRWRVLAPIKDSLYATGKKPKDGAGLTFSSIDGFIYAIMGNNTSVLLKYDPLSNIWYHEAITVDFRKIRDGGSITFALPLTADYDTLLYIFPGKSSKDLRRYDIRRHIWKSDICTIPNPKVKIKSGASSSCQTDLGIIYFFIGGNKQSVYRYHVGINSFDTISQLPLGPDWRNGRIRTKIKKGAAIVATSNDLVYAIKSGNNNEFWAYAVGSEKNNIQPIINSNPSYNKSSTKEIKYSIQPVTTNNNSVINYTLNKTTYVELKLYSITGDLIKTLCNQEQSAGSYSLEIRNLKLGISEGVYFIKGRIGTDQIQNKIIRL